MKPLPLNPKILQGPMKPINPYKKSSTVVKPFNLTACPTKQVDRIRNIAKSLIIAIYLCFTCFRSYKPKISKHNNQPLE